jgi:superfamily II DNA or RNA helicase
VYAPGGIDTSGIKRTAGDFNKAGLSSVADRPVITGNAITHYRRYADRRPAIAFCVSVQHAEHVAQGFCEAGYAAASIDGKMKDHQRARLIHALGAGDLHVLTSCDLISEGVDVPCVSAGIMLRPTQSKGLWMQQVGRCLRPAPGKEFAVILDHAGNSVRHNMLPDSPQAWSLDAAPVKRRANLEPDVISVTVCGECLLTYATADVCPYCGAARPVVARTVEEVDGELELLDAAYEAAGKKLEERQCKSLEDFQALAQARGYKQGWAWRRWEMSWQKRALAAEAQAVSA